MAEKKRVLIADDVDVNRKAIRTFLHFFHFEATLASDGLEAKKALEAEGGAFDLIVSDIEMPNMNGFEFLAFVKKSPIHRNVPVIMLSTLDSPEVMERCKRLGASSYIAKPFTKEKFETALSALNLTTK
jgi:CheY-like chemotaxis protein